MFGFLLGLPYPPLTWKAKHSHLLCRSSQRFFWSMLKRSPLWPEETRKGTINRSSYPYPANLTSLFPTYLLQVIITPSSKYDPLLPIQDIKPWHCSAISYQPTYVNVTCQSTWLFSFSSVQCSRQELLSSSPSFVSDLSINIWNWVLFSVVAKSILWKHMISELICFRCIHFFFHGYVETQ